MGRILRLQNVFSLRHSYVRAPIKTFGKRLQNVILLAGMWRF